VIALRPLYKQLHVNQTITSDFTAPLYQGAPDGEPDIDINWAFEVDQIVGQVIEEFKRQQSGIGDREAMDDRRASVIQSATELKHWLTDIHQIHSYDFDDPDNGESEKETQKKCATVARDSIQSCRKSNRPNGRSYETYSHFGGTPR